MRFTEIDEREQENVAGFSCFFKKTSPGAGEKRIAASLALLAMTWASVSAPKERRADLFPVIARRAKPDVAIRPPRPPCLPLRGRCPRRGRRGLPPNFFILGIDKSSLIIYNKPQEHGSGIKPPLAMTRCPVPCMIQPIITGNPRAPRACADKTVI